MCLDGDFSFNHTCSALSKPFLLPIHSGIISSVSFGLSFHAADFSQLLNDPQLSTNTSNWGYKNLYGNSPYVMQFHMLSSLMSFALGWLDGKSTLRLETSKCQDVKVFLQNPLHILYLKGQTTGCGGECPYFYHLWLLSSPPSPRWNTWSGLLLVAQNQQIP